MLAHVYRHLFRAPRRWKLLALLAGALAVCGGRAALAAGLPPVACVDLSGSGCSAWFVAVAAEGGTADASGDGPLPGGYGSGYVGGGLLAVSNGGTARSWDGSNNDEGVGVSTGSWGEGFVAVAPTGTAWGGLAVSATGYADGGGNANVQNEWIGISLLGCASGRVAIVVGGSCDAWAEWAPGILAINTGSGCAKYSIISVATLGCADASYNSATEGFVAASVEGFASNGYLLTGSVTGPATSTHGYVVSGYSSASTTCSSGDPTEICGTVAGLGSANGGFFAVSGTGSATGQDAAIAPNGDATSECNGPAPVAVTVAGTANGSCGSSTTVSQNHVSVVGQTVYSGAAATTPLNGSH